MFAVPADTPETVPVVEPTEATPALLLDQNPPEVISVSVVDEPAHTLNIPVMATGMGFTVNELLV